MSVSLMLMDNGDIGLFYLVKVRPNYSRIMLSRSSDEGESFYAHIVCSDPNKPFYYVVKNSRLSHVDKRLFFYALFEKIGKQRTELSVIEGFFFE